MRHNYFILSFLLSLILSCTIIRVYGRDYNISYLNMSTGMPSNYVDDVYEDHYGFVWISTRGGGLLRYDGYTFLHLGLSGNEWFWMRSNSCRNSTEDHFSRLWVAFDEGFQVLDLRSGLIEEPKTVSEQLRQQLLRISNEPCLRVYTDSKGAVWVLTVNKIDRIAFDAEGRVASIMSAAHNTKVADLALADLDNNGSVYVGLNFRMSRVSVRGGRLVIESLAKTYPQLTGSIIGAMTRWRGKVWFGTNHGVYNNDAHNAGWHASLTGGGLQNETVTALAATPEGDRLMIGTLSGVDIMDSGLTISEHYNSLTATQTLSSNFVNNIYVSDGRIWIGTETGGITRLVPRLLSLTSYTHDAGDASSLSSGPVNAMLATPGGDLWVGTVEGGLNLMAHGSDRFTHFTTANSGLPHNSVSVLTSDGYGHLWIGTWGGGVSVLSHGVITPLVADGAHARELLFIGAMAWDRYNDGLWIGANAGLFFYDFKTGRVIDPFPECRTINGAIGSIVTRNGRLLMGCVPGLVEVDLKAGRDKNGTFRHKHYLYKLDQPSSKTFDKITAFWQSEDGTLWLGSNGYGMYRVKGELGDSASVKNFITRDGLANNSVKGIVGDGKGNLWIATENGLSLFNTKTQTFNNFTTADGLLSDQFYFNGATTGHGRVYLGSDKGLTCVSGINREPSSSAHLHFTALYVGGQWAHSKSGHMKNSITVADKVQLHEGDRNIRIEFSALNYGGETQGVYSYRLEGYEDDWTTLPPGGHSVTYSSLPGGHYTLEVHYTSPLNGIKEQRASLEVHVKPYFYKSWWFVLIVIVVIVTVATYLYRRRVEVVRQREAELLYRPIEAALRDSGEPTELQERIQMILKNQERYKESQQRSVLSDKESLKEKMEGKEPLMTRVMKTMEEMYADPALNVKMLAEKLEISRVTLGKTLQRELGESTAQFIRDYRLDVASKLLADNVGDRNVTEIAYRVGFNDPKYFTRCFTQRFGVSPKEYKRKK